MRRSIPWDGWVAAALAAAVALVAFFDVGPAIYFSLPWPVCLHRRPNFWQRARQIETA